MKNILLLAAFSLLYCGCTTRTATLSPDAMRDFQGKTIACAVPPPPSFNAMRGGWSLLGPFGSVANTLHGDRLVRDNQIADPAEKISGELVNELAAAYNLKVRPPIPPERKMSCPTDLVLETRTTYWGFCFFLSEWKNYFVTCRAAVRLIDPRTGTCLASGEITVDSRDYAQPRSYDELTAHQAAGLKAELETAREKSSAELLQKILRPGSLRGAAVNQ